MKIEKNELNRLVSARDELFLKLQNKEINKVRIELNRKIKDNAQKENKKLREIERNKKNKIKEKFLENKKFREKILLKAKKEELDKKKREKEKELEKRIKEKGFEEKRKKEEEIRKVERRKKEKRIRAIEKGEKEKKAEKKRIKEKEIRILREKEEKIKVIKQNKIKEKGFEEKRKKEEKIREAEKREKEKEREKKARILRKEKEVREFERRKKEESRAIEKGEKEKKAKKKETKKKKSIKKERKLETVKSVKHKKTKKPQKKRIKKKKQIIIEEKPKIIKLTKYEERKLFKKRKKAEEKRVKEKEEKLEEAKQIQQLNKNTHEKHLDEIEDVKKEIAKIIVGQDVIIEDILKALLVGGHVLIEGVPGIAKTLLIRALAESLGCKFSRIQFTVDLLPTDITGITTYTPGKGFETIKGPIFANFIIADEINRAPPKTQSALLEAMQEYQVTIGKNTHKLELPFFVMANNNPIESSGTYKLPEAQIDRFFFKLNMGYPDSEEEQRIVDQNITLHKFEDFGIKKILSPEKIIRLQKMTRDIQASPNIKKYIVEIVNASRNPKDYGIKLGKYIEWGGSPRASIALYIGAKADAVLKGHKIVTPQNVKNVAHNALRHRLWLNYAGQAENINTDDIITEILSKVKVP